MENQTQTNNTLRRSEKSALIIELVSVMLLILPFAVPALANHLGLLFIPAFLAMPLLFLASFLNLFRLFYDHAPLFGRRTGATVLVLITTPIITIVAGIAMKEILGLALWAMLCAAGG